ANERAQAFVLLAAGGATSEVRAQAGHRRVGVAAGELELDVLVELLEALLAANLVACRPQQPAERLLQLGSLHHFSSCNHESSESPVSCRFSAASVAH